MYISRSVHTALCSTGVLSPEARSTVVSKCSHLLTSYFSKKVDEAKTDKKINSDQITRQGMGLSVGGSLGLEWVSRTSLLQNVSLLPRKSVGRAAAALPATPELAWLKSEKSTRVLRTARSISYLQ